MAEDAYRNPIYNLKAVVEQTSVSADALRAWERRYGLPDPARTEAGHRIYSQRDIDIINWLVARQQEGLRIGRAVKLWRSLKSEGQDPLRSMPFPSATGRQRVATGDTVAELREAWLSASLGFNERAADGALTRAFAMYPPEVVCSQVIAEGIAEIGDKWCRGEATVQQEHFASQLAVRGLERLIAATPPATRRGRILTAAPAGEEHTIGLLTMTLLLRRAGWDVVYLGANVPLERMEGTIEATQPDLLIMVAQQLETAASLLHMARTAQRQEVPSAFGGRIFDQKPELRDRIPGHFLGSAFDKAVERAEALLTTARRAPNIEPLSPQHEEALANYRDIRGALESDVLQAMRREGLDLHTLRELNQTLGPAIDAALTFGDISLADYQLAWLQGLAECNRPPTNQLISYLRAYRRAAETHLDARGVVIIEWLAEWLDHTSES